MQLFLAYALACQKLSELSEKSAREIEQELKVEAQAILETKKMSPTELEAFMNSIITEQGL